MIVKVKPGEIKRLLDEKGLRKPYRELARILGCSAALVTYYIHDQIETPSLEMVVKWARYLDVELENLILVIEDEQQ